MANHNLRLALERESGHLTQETMVADVRRATRQYFLEVLPAETFLVWVAEAQGTIVATGAAIGDGGEFDQLLVNACQVSFLLTRLHREMECFTL